MNEVVEGRMGPKERLEVRVLRVFDLLGDELRGTGLFLRALSTRVYGTPEQAARKAKEHGLRWVALMALGLRGSDAREWTHPIAPLAEYAAAFREAGLDVWVWFFPRADDPERAATIAGAALTACQGAGLILDIEKPYRRRAAACRRLVTASLDQLDETQGIAVTSYPLERYHRTLPWAEMVAGTGMPQGYRILPANARRAVLEWRARGHESIVPVGPAYGPNSGRKLLGYLSDAYLDDGAPIIDGLGIWSWPQKSRTEWAALEQVSRWFEGAA